MKRALSVVAIGIALLSNVQATPAEATIPDIGPWSTPLQISTDDTISKEPVFLSHGGNLTGAWLARSQFDVKTQSTVATSTDGGKTWTQPHTLSQAGQSASELTLAGDGELVTAAWTRYDGRSDNQAQLAVSRDSGHSWGDVTTVSPIGTDAVGIELDVHGNRITLAWYATNQSPSTVHVVTSLDAGVTWSEAHTLSTPDERALLPEIVSTDSAIVVAWRNESGAVPRVESSTSTDNGITWSPPVVISDPAFRSVAPRLASDGSRVVAVWSSFTGGAPRIHSAASTDGGLSWSSPHAHSTRGVSARGQTVEVHDGTFSVRWQQNPATSTDFFMARSTDGGSTWTPRSLISVPAPQSAGVAYLEENGILLALWIVDLDPGSRVEGRVSTDDGLTWSSPMAISPSVPGTITRTSVLPTASGVVMGWEHWKSPTVTVESVRADFVLPEVTPGVTRLSGNDRYETSVAIARQFATRPPVVYVATGENYPDALSASAAAAALGGPLLLTRPNSMPAVTQSELRRLNPSLVVLVGGPNSVSNRVAADITRVLPGVTVRRDSGADRFATSRAIARGAFSTTGAETVFLATGADFPDALSAAAAAGSLGAPVILVNGASSQIDTATRTLLHDLETSRVVIVGGRSAIWPSIATDLVRLYGENNVERLSGDNRFATSLAVNRRWFDEPQTIFLANGMGFADALAGGALAGAQGSPLFIVQPSCVPHGISAYLRESRSSSVVLLGGPSVLRESVARRETC